MPSERIQLQPGAKVYANGEYIGEVKGVHDGPPPRVERVTVSPLPKPLAPDDAVYLCPFCREIAGNMRLSDTRNEPTPDELAARPELVAIAHEIRVCNCGEPLTWFDMVQKKAGAEGEVEGPGAEALRRLMSVIDEELRQGYDERCKAGLPPRRLWETGALGAALAQPALQAPPLEAIRMAFHANREEIKAEMRRRAVMTQDEINVAVRKAAATDRTDELHAAALLQWRKGDGSIGALRGGVISRQVEKAMAGALLGCNECGESEPGWDAELSAATHTMLLTCRCCGAELRFQYRQLFD